MPNMSFFLPLILQSAVIPFAVALAVLILAHRLRLGGIGPALAIAAGFLGTYAAALHAQWSPLPKVVLDWLPWIALVGTAGAAAIERIGGGALRVAARIALSTALAAVVVWPALASLGTQKALLMAGVAGAVTGVIWSYFAHTSDDRPTPPLLLGVIAGGAGLALMLDSSQSIGQLSGALASVLLACAALHLLRLRLVFSPAAAGIAVLLLGALMLNAHIYAEFPLAYIALLAGGLLADPLVEGVNCLRKRHSGAGAWATATVLTAIPVAVAIGLAVKAASDAGGY